MTISSQASRNTYAGNDVTTVFNAPRVFDADHLIATLVEDSTGAITELELDTDYTLDDIGEDVTELTMLVAPPDGFTLNIRREVPIVQSTDVKNQGAFYPEIHEDQFDYRCMVEQMLADALSRAVLQPDDGGFNYDFQQNRGINVADPVGAQDIVNFRTLQAAIDSAADFGTPRVPLEFEFEGDGAETEFDCPGISGVDDARVYIVTIDGVVQNPVDDYTVDDTAETVTFTTAPPDESDINIRLFGFMRSTLPVSNTAGTHTFYRGDGNYANRLISTTYGELPDPPPEDAFAMFIVEANAAHTGIKILGGTLGSVMFGTDGGETSYEMEFGYNASLEALVWNAHGSTVFGQLFKTGDIALGTYNSLYVDRDNIRVGIGGNTAPTVALDVTGDILASGTITGDIDGTSIVSGYVAPARLGSGTPGSTTFLNGLGQWAVPPGTGGGGGNTVNVEDAGLAAAPYDTLILSGSTSAAAVSSLIDLYIDDVTGSTATIKGYVGEGGLLDNTITMEGFSVIGKPDAGDGTSQSITAASDHDVLRREGGVLDFGLIDVLSIDAAGTPDATTFLRGDGEWAAVSASNAVDEWTLYDSDESRDEFKIKRSSLAGGSTAVQFQQWSHAASAWRDTLKIDWNTTTFAGEHGTLLTVPTGKCLMVGTPDSTGKLKLSCDELILSFITTISFPTNSIDHTALAEATAPAFLGATGSGSQDITQINMSTATAMLTAMVGDSGSGGTKGMVPAPAAGDAAAGKYLKADGTWTTIPSAASFADTATIDFTVGGTVSAAIVPGSVGATQLANLGVTNGKIADGAVTTAKIGSTAVTSSKIAASAVGISHIGATGSPSSSTFLRGDGAWASAGGALFYNVKDYGAVGNGSADDTSAINSAYSAASAAGGGILYFPKGTYKVTSTLTWNGPVSVIGEGSGHFQEAPFGSVSHLAWGGSVNGTMIDITGVQGGLRFVGFSVGGSQSLTASSWPGIVMRLDSVQGSLFQNIAIANFNTTGLYLAPNPDASGVSQGKNCHGNMFQNMLVSADGTGVCVRIGTRSTTFTVSTYYQLVNSCHNTFTNMFLMSENAYCIQLDDNDNNAFFQTFCFRATGTGCVLVNKESRSNYFYHQQGEIVCATGVSGARSSTYVFGYDQSNGQAAPAGAAFADVFYTDILGGMNANVGNVLSRMYLDTGAAGGGDWRFISPAVPSGKLLQNM